MAELKTRPTDVDVATFLASIPDERKRRDSQALLQVLEEVTGEQPKLWGPSIVGFGEYHYRYESGHEGDSFIAGFSPRKQNITLYSAGAFGEHPELLAKLGKHKLGKGCLYINKLQDVDQAVLRTLLATVVAEGRARAA